jgi:hypothetical protein
MMHSVDDPTISTQILSEVTGVSLRYIAMQFVDSGIVWRTGSSAVEEVWKVLTSELTASVV